jgi:hypothetical protein
MAKYHMLKEQASTKTTSLRQDLDKVRSNFFLINHGLLSRQIKLHNDTLMDVYLCNCACLSAPDMPCRFFSLCHI